MYTNRRTTFGLAILILGTAACGDSNEPGMLDRVAAAREAVGDAKNSAAAYGEMAEAAKEAAANAEAGIAVEPVDFRDLQALLPGELPGMERVHAGGEKVKMMGSVSKTTAEYESVDENDPGTVSITITDLGALQSAIAMSMAAWSAMEIDRESDTGFERSMDFRDYPAHIKFERDGEGTTGDGEMQAMIEKRFVVQVRGRNLDADRIRAAMDRVDTGALAAMKDVGVTRPE